MKALCHLGGESQEYWKDILEACEINEIIFTDDLTTIETVLLQNEAYTKEDHDLCLFLLLIKEPDQKQQVSLFLKNAERVFALAPLLIGDLSPDPTHDSWYTAGAVAVISADDSTAIQKAKIKSAVNIRRNYLNLLTRSSKYFKSVKRYRNFIEDLPDIVYHLDENGNFTVVNSAIKYLGYTASEIIGMHFSILIHPEDYQLCSRDIVLKNFYGKTTGEKDAPRLFDERRSGNRATRNLIVRLIQKKSEFDHQENVVLAYGEIVSAGDIHFSESGQLGSIGIIRDVTERRIMEEELRLSNQISEQGNKTKLDLLSTIIYKLRNQLQTTSSLVDSLKNEGLNQSQTEKVEAIEESNKTLLASVRDLVDLNKIDNGNLVLQKSAFSLKQLLKSVTDLFEIKVSQKEIQLITDFGELTNDLVVGDQQLIRHILINLLNNAIKFTNDGGVFIRLEIVKRNATETFYLHARMIDSGIGIPQDKVKNFFDIYGTLQAEHSYSAEYRPGLGVMVIKKLIDITQGSIEVFSPPRFQPFHQFGGTEFEFFIPISLSDSENLSLKSHPGIVLNLPLSEA